MLDRRVEHFFFRAGNLQRAIFFARIIPAIDRFPCVGHKNWSAKVVLLRRKSGVKPSHSNAASPQKLLSIRG